MSGGGVKDWRREGLGAQIEKIEHEVVVAICEAHVEAAAAQHVQGSNANDTYGHTLKVRQHELLNSRLKKIPGVELRRPAGVHSRFEFPVIEETNAVIVPLRFSNDPRVRHDQVSRIDLSKLRLALLLGPERPREPDLLEVMAGGDYEGRYAEALEAYEQLVTAGRTLVTGFGSTPEGIFEIGLGELSVDDPETGAISWCNWHALPIYTDLATVPAAPSLRAVPSLTTVERFDAGFEKEDNAEDLKLRLRPVAESAPDPEARDNEVATTAEDSTT